MVFGESIELKCYSVGTPPFNLSIAVDDHVLVSSSNVGRSVPLTYTLEITDDSNYMTYTCSSKNSVGSDTDTVTLVKACEFLLTML